MTSLFPRIERKIALKMQMVASLKWKRLICHFKISLFQSQKGYSCFALVVRGGIKPRGGCATVYSFVRFAHCSGQWPVSAACRTASGETTFTTETVFPVPSARLVLRASMRAAA